MDKYEFNIKVDQIKKLAAKKSYAEAAAIAKQMNWQKVKDWPTLATVINVQEAVGDYLEARDMAILAYNRNLGGRKLVYKLTEFLIKLEDYENAEELYDEYEKMSPHDVNRYILYYQLRKAQNASDNELVEILEDYKEHEIDEKYMFELAQLYSKTGRKEECVKTCDDIVLWFQDGVYVEKAIKLKQEFGVTLTNTQKKILENARNTKRDLENTKQILFEKHQEMARIKQDDIEEALTEFEDEPLKEKDNEGTIKSFFKKAFANLCADEEDDEKEEDKEYSGKDNSDNEIKEISSADDTDDADIVYEQDEEDETYGDRSADSARDSAKDLTAVTTVADKTREVAPVEKRQAVSADDSESTLKNLSEENLGSSIKNKFTSSASEIDKASVSLKELIAQAKQKLEDSYDKINKEEEEERRKLKEEEALRQEEEKRLHAEEERKQQERLHEQEEIEKNIEARKNSMDIKVDIPNYSLYDTQNIQEELAKNLKKVLADDEAVQSLKPSNNISEGQQAGAEEENPQDEQIEGQLNLEDWMEAVREKKYGNRDTKKFSKAELDRMLDEKDEKSAAYEKLIAEQKALAQAKGTKFNEAEARIKARTEMMLHAAKTDLAIRTGKATVKIEEEINNLTGVSKPAEPQKDDTSIVQEELTATTEALKFDTAHMEKVDEEIINSVRAIMAENEDVEEMSDEQKAEEEAANTVSDPDRELSQNIVESDAQALDGLADTDAEDSDSNEDIMHDAADQDKVYEETEYAELISADDDDNDNVTAQEDTQSQTGRDADGAVSGTDDSAYESSDDDFDEDNMSLTGDLEKIFRKYVQMPGMEEQLAKYFNTIDTEMRLNTSSTGNIIISGNSSSDKIDLARTVVRAINHLYPENPKKIAKTTGDSINNRGITKAMAKLRGTVLIVEGAGIIKPKRIEEMLACMSQDTSRMIVIFEDSDVEINGLLNFNPGLEKWFNHRFILKQYTVNELVEMARKFARKRKYEVDDNALLELYLKIDKLHAVSDNIKLDDIKQIINNAIVRSEKRASRRFFGGLKKKRGANGDIIFLSEADFKD